MIDPSTGIGNVTAIQIRLKPGVDGDAICRKLRRRFRRNSTACKPGATSKAPCLAAVQMETAILNVLLFMIIAVAGFGILAIFYMIVVEKTRDIGILKSLGASGGGIMGIFLAYGLSLGIVGSGVGHDRSGCCSSPTSTRSPNCWACITGQQVFDPDDLLLPTDSDAGRSVHRELDRDRGHVDRRGGQYFAGAPCRSLASRGGPAL